MCIYFSPANSLACAAISSINAHYTRLVKLFSFNFVCPKIILRKYFFYEILLDEIKANYGISVRQHQPHTVHVEEHGTCNNRIMRMLVHIRSCYKFLHPVQGQIVDRSERNGLKNTHRGRYVQEEEYTHILPRVQYVAFVNLRVFQ